MAHCSSGKAAGNATTGAVVALFGCILVGCQSNLNSQLLERELRLQEDQIYRLQDVLDEKCARLDSVVQENASLKRQLGYGGGASSSSPRGPSPAGRSAGTGSGGPSFVPPTIELSDPAPPSTLPPPPALEGVPPLPQSSAPGDSEGGGDAPPAVGLMPEVSLPASNPAEPGGFQPAVGSDATAETVEEGPSFAPAFVAPQAAAPGLLDEAARQASAMQPSVNAAEQSPIQQLSFVEPVSGDPVSGDPVSGDPVSGDPVAVMPPATDVAIERIVINRDETQLIDTDANGSADAVAVVFEPRDREERLVSVAGDVVIEVHQATATAPAAAMASWGISAADAASTFRSTSRSRGFRFLLPWKEGPQRGFTGVVRVRLRSPSGSVLEAETPVSLP